MKSLLNIRFWLIGAVLGAVPLMSILRGYQFITLNGWPEQLVATYEFWRGRGLQLLSEGVTMLGVAVGGISGDAASAVLILLGLALAAKLSGIDRNDDRKDKVKNNRKA